MLPTSPMAIVKYINVYLNQKKDSNFSVKELELQKKFIILMLRQQGVIHATYDDNFLRSVVNGTFEFPKRINADMFRQRRLEQYQSLANLYSLYCDSACTYSELFAAFQNYFDLYFDVYSDEWLEEEVISEIESLLKPAPILRREKNSRKEFKK